MDNIEMFSEFFEDIINLSRAIPNLPSSTIYSELLENKNDQNRVLTILKKYFASYNEENENSMSTDIKIIKRVLPDVPIVQISSDLTKVENKNHRVQLVLKKCLENENKPTKRSLELMHDASSGKKSKINETESLEKENEETEANNNENPEKITKSMENCDSNDNTKMNSSILQNQIEEKIQPGQESEVYKSQNSSSTEEYLTDEIESMINQTVTNLLRAASYSEDEDKNHAEITELPIDKIHVPVISTNPSALIPIAVPITSKIESPNLNSPCNTVISHTYTFASQTNNNPSLVSTHASSTVTATDNAVQYSEYRDPVKTTSSASYENQNKIIKSAKLILYPTTSENFPQYYEKNNTTTSTKFTNFNNQIKVIIPKQNLISQMSTKTKEIFVNDIPCASFNNNVLKIPANRTKKSKNPVLKAKGNFSQNLTNTTFHLINNNNDQLRSLKNEINVIQPVELSPIPRNNSNFVDYVAPSTSSHKIKTISQIKFETNPSHTNSFPLPSTSTSASSKPSTSAVKAVENFTQYLNTHLSPTIQPGPSTSQNKNVTEKKIIRVRTDLYDSYYNGVEVISEQCQPSNYGNDESETDNDDVILMSVEKIDRKPILIKSEKNLNPAIVVDDPQTVPVDLSNLVSSEACNKIMDTSQEPDHPYFFKLMEMFPDICPAYLRNMCSGRPESNETLDYLISVLLMGDYKRRNRVPTPEAHFDFEEQYKLFLDLFPDCDPTYLQHHCERLIDQPEEMKDFIAMMLESIKYPSKADYLKKMKLCAQEKQYTTEFDVQKFLEIIPNPDEYFNKPNRSVCTNFDDTNYALTFLKNNYSNVTIREITHVFKICNFNVLAASNMLDQTPRIMKCNRKPYPVTSCANIPLLQEIAYIKNRKDISNYIKSQEQEKLQCRIRAKEAGLMKSCECCFDDEVMPEDTACCEANHIFCKECVRKGSEVKIGEGKLDFPCLTTCESYFSLQILQTVLTPKVFSKMAQRKQMEEVKSAGIEDLEFCPFCDFATIPAPGDKLFRCLNSDCMKESCRQCREASHIPLRCEEIEKEKDVKIRTYIEDKMTEALVRKCYKCGLKFVKEDGCNKMTCSCGAMMCYVCNSPVKDYKHFNGQGGDQLHLCPLYSDTNLLHMEAVKRSAENAIKELGIDNGQLKIDPTQNLDQHYKRIAAQNHQRY